MQSIGEVLNSLNLGKPTDFDPQRLNKEKRPNLLKCPKCGKDKVDWFWLESECLQVLPSQWKPHRCRCMILDFLKGRRSFINFNLNLLNKKSGSQIDKEIKEEKDKILLASKVIKAIEELKNNEEYYAERFEPADDLSAFENYRELVWDWLFDCKSKEETEFYLNVLKLEQPKETDDFIFELEKIKEEVLK